MSNPAIVVVAYNRPASLGRLLGSLLRAEYPCKTQLVISIDGGGNDDVVKAAHEFKWPAGKKEIIQHSTRMGLREHILACGDLSERYGSVLVLEDDLYVSPMFYCFALQAAEFYRDRPEIGGIGLYAYRENRCTSTLFEPIADEADVVFLQYACSWGQVWTSAQWQPFRQWYRGQKAWGPDDGAVPRHVTHWPETSWLKYHIKYLVATNRYFVYPRVSLTTCYQEPGEHFAAASSRCQVVLQLAKKDFHFKPMAESCCVYDAWQTIVPDRLNRMVPKLADHDYVVDFYGIKPLDHIPAPCVLGCWNSDRPIMEYGLQMRPVEMNVIESVSGKGITLACKTDIQRRVAPERHAIRTYPELGARRLSRMAQGRVIEKIRRRLGLAPQGQ